MSQKEDSSKQVWKKTEKFGPAETCGGPWVPATRSKRALEQETDGRPPRLPLTKGDTAMSNTHVSGVERTRGSTAG